MKFCHNDHMNSGVTAKNIFCVALTNAGSKTNMSTILELE